MKTKCFIVGFAPSWVETPWEDPDAEIFTLNEFYKLAEKEPRARADRWFEIHSLERPPKNNPDHIKFLQEVNVPVYTLQKYDFLPNGIPFPFTEIIDWMKERGHIGYRYFTNSISWMIAFALMEGFKEIHVYGVDMAQYTDTQQGNSEYAYQKPSCEYMLGVAEKYAKVYIPETSDLLKCSHLYGIDMDNERFVFYKKQRDEMKNRRKQVAAELQKAQNAVGQLQIADAELRGALSAYDHMLVKRI